VKQCVRANGFHAPFRKNVTKRVQNKFNEQTDVMLTRRGTQANCSHKKTKKGGTRVKKIINIDIDLQQMGLHLNKRALRYRNSKDGVNYRDKKSSKQLQEMVSAARRARGKKRAAAGKVEDIQSPQE